MSSSVHCDSPPGGRKSVLLRTVATPPAPGWHAADRNWTTTPPPLGAKGCSQQWATPPPPTLGAKGSSQQWVTPPPPQAVQNGPSISPPAYADKAANARGPHGKLQLLSDVPAFEEQLETNQPCDLCIGDLVEVAARTWPGINKPGGFGKITRCNPNNTFNVNYVLGGSEKNVERQYITSKSLLQQVAQRPKKGRDFFFNYDSATHGKRKADSANNSSHGGSVADLDDFPQRHAEGSLKRPRGSTEPSQVAGKARACSPPESPTSKSSPRVAKAAKDTSAPVAVKSSGAPPKEKAPKSRLNKRLNSEQYEMSSKTPKSRRKSSSAEEHKQPIIIRLSLERIKDDAPTLPEKSPAAPVSESKPAQVGVVEATAVTPSSGDAAPQALSELQAAEMDSAPSEIADTVVSSVTTAEASNPAAVAPPAKAREDVVPLERTSSVGSVKSSTTSRANQKAKRSAPPVPRVNLESSFAEVADREWGEEEQSISIEQAQTPFASLIKKKQTWSEVGQAANTIIHEPRWQPLSQGSLLERPSSKRLPIPRNCRYGENGLFRATLEVQRMERDDAQARFLVEHNQIHKALINSLQQDMSRDCSTSLTRLESACLLVNRFWRPTQAATIDCSQRKRMLRKTGQQWNRLRETTLARQRMEASILCSRQVRELLAACPSLTPEQVVEQNLCPTIAVEYPYDYEHVDARED